MSNSFDFEAIKNVLPHRYPFLLVDKVLEVSKECIVGIKNVTANEPFFTGHFPGKAVMPGVLQIEAMAQVAGLLLAFSGGFNVKQQIAFLVAVDEAKFKKLVVPGDQLFIKASVLACRKSLLKVSASCEVNQTLVSEAIITLIIKDLLEA
jgi:beta-hydroxyacyl-ACP dehydratase FabZ